jgi:hypothetical protein
MSRDAPKNENGMLLREGAQQVDVKTRSTSPGTAQPKGHSRAPAPVFLGILCAHLRLEMMELNYLSSPLRNEAPKSLRFSNHLFTECRRLDSFLFGKECGLSLNLNGWALQRFVTCSNKEG